MANEIENRIMVSGDDAEILRMKEYVKSEDDNFDFSKICPDGEWGTRGRAYYTYVSDDGKEIEFTTVWTPPSPILEKLSEMFPTLVFTHISAGLDENFSSRTVWSAGKILSEEWGNFIDFYWGDQEFKDAYNEE
jgi:hypothetical protein